MRVDFKTLLFFSDLSEGNGNLSKVGKSTFWYVSMALSTQSTYTPVEFKDAHTCWYNK